MGIAGNMEGDCNHEGSDMFAVVEETVLTQEESLEDSSTITITWGKLQLKISVHSSECKAKNIKRQSNESIANHKPHENIDFNINDQREDVRKPTVESKNERRNRVNHPLKPGSFFKSKENQSSVVIEDVSDLQPSEFEDTTSQQPIIESVLENDEKLQFIEEDQERLTIEEILEPPDSKKIAQSRIEADKILIHIAVERMMHIPDECVKECTNLQAQSNAKERTFVLLDESTEKDCNLSFDDLVIRESPV